MMDLENSSKICAQRLCTFALLLLASCSRVLPETGENLGNSGVAVEAVDNPFPLPGILIAIENALRGGDTPKASSLFGELLHNPNMLGFIGSQLSRPDVTSLERMASARVLAVAIQANGSPQQETPEHLLGDGARQAAFDYIQLLGLDSQSQAIKTIGSAKAWLPQDGQHFTDLFQRHSLREVLLSSVLQAGTQLSAPYTFCDAIDGAALALRNADSSQHHTLESLLLSFCGSFEEHCLQRIAGQLVEYIAEARGHPFAWSAIFSYAKYAPVNSLEYIAGEAAKLSLTPSGATGRRPSIPFESRAGISSLVMSRLMADNLSAKDEYLICMLEDNDTLLQDAVLSGSVVSSAAAALISSKRKWLRDDVDNLTMYIGAQVDQPTNSVWGISQVLDGISSGLANNARGEMELTGLRKSLVLLARSDNIEPRTKAYLDIVIEEI